MEDQEAVDICSQYLDDDDLVEEASARLRDIAYFRGSGDNISVMVIQPISGIDLKVFQKKEKCIIS